MGRNPKPTALKKLEGTYRKDRATPNEMSGRVLFQLPKPPSKLDRWGKAAWKQIGGLLIEHHLIQDLDLPALEQLAFVSGQLLKAGNELRKFKNQQTVTQRNRRGYENEVINPAVKVYQSWLNQWIPLVRDFGLTPSSRSKIPAPPKNNTNPLFDLLDGVSSKSKPHD